MKTSAREYCAGIVSAPSLEAKLEPPRADLGYASDDEEQTHPTTPDWPARDECIALVDSAGGKLPPLSALRDPQARAQVLSKFAHHELCAVELFAWAVATLPMPAALARGLVVTLAEEQVHCRLYLERLAPVAFGSFPLSDYFWKHTPAIKASPTPALAFLCAMGLTLEQANLDFTLLYRDAFRAAGDEESALVIQRVHDDEVGHVALAALWVKKLAGTGDVEAYQAHIPFPFSLARAKGRRFDVASRKRALLSTSMIDAVRDAKPYLKAKAP